MCIASWDYIQLSYIEKHKGYFDNEGFVHFSETESNIPFGDSIRYPNKKTIMIPSVKGPCLLFESLHFIIDRKD